MDYPFRPSLLVEPKSYAVNTPQGVTDLLDCSMGVNPYGYPASAAEAFRQFDLGLLADYPHSSVLRDALCRYWAPFLPISGDMLFFCDGSISGVYCVNNLFAQTERNEVVGYAPSFTDVMESARRYGLEYREVPLRMEAGGHAAPEDLIAALSEKTAFLYLDRPNNPTGQTMPLSEVAVLADAARKVGAWLFVDEAYGDFIPQEESALCLCADHDNLFVLRTFSKGFGLPNLRAGYLIAPPEMITLLWRSGNPYVLSDLDRKVCAAALEGASHTTAHADDFAAVKKAVRAAIAGSRLWMLETDDRVPIFTLGSRRDTDLQSQLLQYGVLAVSGREFAGLGEQYVRIRIPVASETERMVQTIAALAGEA